MARAPFCVLPAWLTAHVRRPELAEDRVTALVFCGIDLFRKPIPMRNDPFGHRLLDGGKNKPIYCEKGLFQVATPISW